MSFISPFHVVARRPLNGAISGRNFASSVVEKMAGELFLQLRKASEKPPRWRDMSRCSRHWFLRLKERSGSR